MHRLRQRELFHLALPGQGLELARSYRGVSSSVEGQPLFARKMMGFATLAWWLFLASYVSRSSPLLLLLLAVALPLALFPLTWLLRRAMNPAREARWHSAIAAPPLPGFELEAKNPTFVRGRVRMRESLRAPLSGRPCVASRLVGRYGRFEIDDGFAVAFDLVSKGRKVAEVHPEPARIDIHAGKPRRVRVVPALRDLFEARGLWNVSEFADLAEGTISEGDEVLVSGLAEVEAQPVGYRDLEYERILFGTLASPVHIRHAASPTEDME